MNGFIGLHIGAGNHSNHLISQYETLCSIACQQAVEKLRQGELAIDVVCHVTKLLEDSELTNTGIGSNLTWDGTVECDASLMDGVSLNFGAIGAVTCVKNPIILARKIFDDQFKSLSLQRVSPCFVVGKGARRIAEVARLTVPPNTLITEKNTRSHKRYRRNAEKQEAEEVIVKQGRLDTVGAVCADVNGNIAATCSSGGIALKQSGRVGQAGVYGCGCWAQRRGLEKGVATSVSGTGEDLIKTTLAKEVAMAISKSELTPTAVYDTIQSSFLESPFLSQNSEKLCGVLALEVRESNNGGEFIWAHTTNTMGVGYMSTKHKYPKVKISKLPVGVMPGNTVTIEGVPW